MLFKSKELVVKISVSDLLKSKAFYENVLSFKEDNRYTINIGGNYATESYMQLNLKITKNNNMVLGLYKDIDKPYQPMPQTGSVPSFIVDDIEGILSKFLSQKVVIDQIDGQYIISNTSDNGYTDHFFFFRDPDNNSLVIRQNLEKKPSN